MRRAPPIVAGVLGVLIVAVSVMVLLRGRDGDGGRDDAVSVGGGAQSPPLTSGGAAPTGSLGALPQSTNAGAMAAAAEPPAVVDPAGILLFGSLTDETGRRLEAGALSLNDRTVSVSIEKGRGYAVAGLHPGRWEVYGSSPKHRPLRETLELAATSLRMRKDFVLRRATILKVRFVGPGGEPLTAALRDLKSDDMRPIFPTALATEGRPTGDLPLTSGSTLFFPGAGRFHASRADGGDAAAPESGVNGLLELDGDLPAYVSAVVRHVVLATELVEPGAEGVTLTIDPAQLAARLASVRIRLVDADTKQPLTKAQIALTDRQMGGGGVPPGPDGVLLLKNVRPGLLALEITAPERERFWRLVRVLPGRENDLGTFELAQAVTIKGRVSGELGEGSSCIVLAYRLDRSTTVDECDQPLSARVGADGAFEIKRAGRGRYAVVATAKSFGIAGAFADTTAGGATGVALEARKGARVTLIRRSTALVRCIVQVKDSEGVPLWCMNHRGDHDPGIWLSPGAYRVEVYENDAVTTAKSFSVDKNALRIELTP